MLDPRVQDNAEKIKALQSKIKKLETAVWILTNNLDGITWRVSSEEERRAGIGIADKIEKLLEIGKGET